MRSSLNLVTKFIDGPPLGTYRKIGSFRSLVVIVQDKMVLSQRLPTGAPLSSLFLNRDLISSGLTSHWHLFTGMIYPRTKPRSIISSLYLLATHSHVCALLDQLRSSFFQFIVIFHSFSTIHIINGALSCLCVCLCVC